MESSQQDIRNYARLVLRKKGLFFAVAASIIAVFIIAGYLMPKTYEATCTVLVEKSVYDEYVKGIAITPSGEQSFGGLSFSLTSKSLVLKTLKDLGLVSDGMDPKKEEGLVGSFQGRTTITIPPNKANPRMINLFQVSFRDTDPELARDYVNTLVRRYIAEDLSGKREDTSESKRLLSGQVQLFKNKIDAIEAELVRFNTGNNVYVTVDEAKLGEKLSLLQNRLAELSAMYTDDYPEVITVKTEIRHLQNQFANLQARSVMSKTKASDTGKKRMDLERERDTYKKVYEELVERLSQSEVSQQMGPLDRSEIFNISEPAALPTKPVSPDRVTVILVGILAGLAGGIGVIALLDAMDQSVKSSKSLRPLGLPVLAVIPKIQSDQQVRQEKRRDGILYGIAVLYLLCVLAIVAVEAMGLTDTDTVAHQSAGAGKAAVKGSF